MELFIKIIRWIFYILVAACILLYIFYSTSEPKNEDLYDYFLYCGVCAVGLSMIRFVLRFMY